MELHEFYGKRVKVEAKNGKTLEGEVNDYCYPEDNDNGKESIIIDTSNSPPIGFYESDINQ